MMNTLFSTKVTATGGRHGHIRSEDGLLDMKLAPCENHHKHDTDLNTGAKGCW
jgi:organic hydroperoxide reductase OsmC/OhrA